MAVIPIPLKGDEKAGRGKPMLIMPAPAENAKDTLCRNVTIYGHCRYEDKGAQPPRIQLEFSDSLGRLLIQPRSGQNERATTDTK